MTGAERIVIPMDQTQVAHLPAYAAAYWIVRSGREVTLVLDENGGAFHTDRHPALELSLRDAGIVHRIHSKADPMPEPATDRETGRVTLARTPRIAILGPAGDRPWTDPVSRLFDEIGVPRSRSMRTASIERTVSPWSTDQAAA